MVELLQGVTQPNVVITATVSEPEAKNEAAIQSGFLQNARDCGQRRKELWLCAN